jgi:hypothetical protein
MEAIEDVYKCNRFRLSTVTAFWCFRRLVSNRLFEMIQDLYMQYPYRQGHDYVYGLILGTPPYNQDCWNKTWEEIYKIGGLKRVRVDIYVHAKGMHADHEKVFFTPLDGLRNEVEAEVYVTWAKDDDLPERRTWPFALRRRMDYHKEIDGSFRLEGEWTY